MIRDQYNKKYFATACVTGASSGIGEAISRQLAGRGINLMLAGRNVAKLSALAEELRNQVEVHIFPGDLALKDDRTMLINNIHHYVPDLVINNAGAGLYGDALSYETTEQMRLLYINSEALLEITLEAARAMISANKKGVIMNVSSVAGYMIFPGSSVYAASKAFVNVFSESFDEETRCKGVRVLASCPGMVVTQFRSRASRKGDKAVTDTGVMTADFAAREIWKQIQSGQKIRVFDWKYRLLRFVTLFLPDRVIAKILYKIMKRRMGEREIIER